MLPQCVWACMYVSHVLSWRTCFIGVLHLLWRLQSFHLLFQSPGWGEFNGVIGQAVDAQHKANSTISLEVLCLIMLSQLIFTSHVTGPFCIWIMDSGLMFLWDSCVQTCVSLHLYFIFEHFFGSFLLFVCFILVGFGCVCLILCILLLLFRCLFVV